MHSIYRYILIYGALAECDRVGGSYADHLRRHRRHGVHPQVITAPSRILAWIPPAFAGHTHDLTASRRHRIITCIRLGVLVLTDNTEQGAATM